MGDLPFTVTKFSEENDYVQVRDMPHYYLGNCQIITFVRKLKSQEEYIEVLMEMPPEEIKTLKVYITNKGLEITGNSRSPRMTSVT